MIVNPAIVALTVGSGMLTLSSLYATSLGVRILRRWDIRSGSELQLSLERRTYLISVVLDRLMSFQVLSLFLFIYTADQMHSLFVGAMCAAGSLEAGEFGTTVLLLKVVNVILCGLWLLLNHMDGKGWDYPLIRPKYRLLIGVTALLMLEGYLQWRYFASLEANVITSCCGTLFDDGSASVSGRLAAMPPLQGMFLLFGTFLATLRVGVHFLFTGEGARLFGALCLASFLAGVAGLVSFVSVYYYELPTHHCPYCVLQGDYGFIGYPMYASLLTGVIFGLGVALMQRHRHLQSLSQAVPRAQRLWCLTAMSGFAAFGLMALYPMVFSDFRLVP